MENNTGLTQLPELLEQSAAHHKHLCPRQVLGVRMGLLAGELLGLEVPQENKRLLALVETDGCFADGIAVAAGCWVGRRTMRVVDFGKVAATFVDTKTEHAIRIVPNNKIRHEARRMIPGARSRWHAQLEAYQIMSDQQLLDVRPVALTVSLRRILSKPGYRVNCQMCAEEIINEREIVREETVLCRACAGHSYYRLARWADTQFSWQLQDADRSIIDINGMVE